MTRNGQVHDGSADKFALRKTLRRHRGYPGGVDWHWRTSIRLRRRNGAHTGKRLAGKLHEPVERAGRGRAYAPPLPTLPRASSAIDSPAAYRSANFLRWPASSADGRPFNSGRKNKNNGEISDY